MFKSVHPSPSAAPKKSAVIALIVMVALVPALTSNFVRGQPREVMLAVYAAYVAALAAIGNVVLQRRGRRGAAVVAVVIGVIFTGLFAGYAYLAYRL